MSAMRMCCGPLRGSKDERRSRAGSGFTLLFEPFLLFVIETADDAMELMRSVARDNVKVMFDTFHALYRNEIPADYVRAMRDDLVHIHVSDSNRVIPGEGRVDCRFPIGLDRTHASVKRVRI